LRHVKGDLYEERLTLVQFVAGNLRRHVDDPACIDRCSSRLIVADRLPTSGLRYCKNAGYEGEIGSRTGSPAAVSDGCANQPPRSSFVEGESDRCRWRDGAECSTARCDR
jgi:hypothetical protein